MEHEKIAPRIEDVPRSGASNADVLTVITEVPRDASRMAGEHEKAREAAILLRVGSSRRALMAEKKRLDAMLGDLRRTRASQHSRGEDHKETDAEIARVNVDRGVLDGMIARGIEDQDLEGERHEVPLSERDQLRVERETLVARGDMAGAAAIDRRIGEDFDAWYRGLLNAA